MTAFPEDVDVLIVGYGPVGAAIAGLLGRYGARTLVVDRLPDIFLLPRAIALDNEALRILQMVGLAEDAFAKVVIPHVRMHCPHVGEFGRINTAGTIDGHPKLVTFYQPELERALRAHAERQPGVTARTGVEMVRFSEDRDGVRVVLRTSAGVEAVVRTRYLVGADGASSNVRTAIDLDFEGETYSEDWLIVDALGVPDNIDHVEFLCNPDRPTPHMVAPGGRTRWEFMLKPGETPEEMEKDSTIASLLMPWAKADEIRIERKAVYRFHARVCKRFSKGRVFLAGDAAHVTPPFAGQGLVAGLRDAANLAWKLAWVVRGRASEAILDTYDQERRPHAAKMIRLAKFMGQLVMPREPRRERSSCTAAWQSFGGYPAIRAPFRRARDEAEERVRGGPVRPGQRPHAARRVASPVHRAFCRGIRRTQRRGAWPRARARRARPRSAPVAVRAKLASVVARRRTHGAHLAARSTTFPSGRGEPRRPRGPSPAGCGASRVVSRRKARSHGLARWPRPGRRADRA